MEKMKKEKGSRKNRFRQILKILLILALIAGIVGGIALFCVNAAVKSAAKGRILTPEEAAALTDVDCILVLGCQVKPDGTPSSMLNDRVLQGVELYQLGVSPVLLMSGDSRDADSYDEVGTMRRVAERQGVPSDAVLMDGYGLSTYDSVYRAAKLYGYDKIVIVTQKYHLYRAIYIAEKYGIEAYGIPSNLQEYRGQWKRDLREVAARAKDFLFCLIKPEAELGIDVWGEDVLGALPPTPVKTLFEKRVLTISKNFNLPKLRFG